MDSNLLPGLGKPAADKYSGTKIRNGSSHSQSWPAGEGRQRAEIDTGLNTMKQLIASFVTLAAAMVCHADYHTNVITTPGGAFAYTVDGVPNNPTIELQAGVTNILDIKTDAFHPVVITTTPNKLDHYSGAAPQSVSSQPITLTTPTVGFPTNLYYVCSFHGFFGQIHMTGLASPVPPPNTVLMVRVGTNVVMTSTGTNTTWLLVPEYSSNLTAAVWTPVPNFTNTYADGTNTTVFDRLDPICGPSVFLRVSQRPN